MKHLVNGALVEMEEDSKEITAVKDGNTFLLQQRVGGFSFTGEYNIRSTPTKGEAVAAAIAEGYEIHADGIKIL